MLPYFFYISQLLDGGHRSAEKNSATSCCSKIYCIMDYFEVCRNCR